MPDRKTNRLHARRQAADVHAEQQGGLPALTIQIDRARLARYGVNASDALAVVAAIGGHRVGMVYGKNGVETPIEVRLAPEARGSVERIRDLPVGIAGGQTVPLSAVAEISVAEGQMEVTRDRLKRRIAVDINVSGRDVQSFATEAQHAIAEKLKLPSSCTLEWSGTFKNLQSATIRLELVLPAVLAVIFLLLYLNFESLRLSALIFLNVPMAASGGIVALVLRGMPFSVTAGIGFISIFGVAILDGVVLTSYIEEERAAGRSPRAAASEAAEKRLRPVLTTALVASIGFIPMALSTSAGAEVQRPLATVVIGGLITATLLTLLVLPSLYPVIIDAKLPAWRWLLSRSVKRRAPAE